MDNRIRIVREKDQACAIGLGSAGKLNNLCGIAREIPYRGIDLSQRNLHLSSVKAGGATAKSR